MAETIGGIEEATFVPAIGAGISFEIGVEEAAVAYILKKEIDVKSSGIEMSIKFVVAL